MRGWAINRNDDDYGQMAFIYEVMVVLELLGKYAILASHFTFERILLMPVIASII